MKVNNEAGVLSRSERFFATPSSLARKLLFYVTRCGHYYYDERYRFTDHCDIGKLESHKNYFLLYVRAGAIGFETDSSRFLAEQGYVALVDCHRPHCFYAPGAAEALWIHFDGANAGSFFEQILAFRKGKQTFRAPAGYPLEQELTQLIAGLRDGQSTEVARSQGIYRILCALLLPLPPVESGSGTDGASLLADRQPVSQAMRLIDAHLAQPLSVAELAKAVHLSPSHFSRLFRSTTGFSPHEYIVLHRINRAKTLLHSTTLSVKEIAYQVGYHSETNFIVSFLHKVGMSPTAFRQSGV